jgi:hypothetical protein
MTLFSLYHAVLVFGGNLAVHEETLEGVLRGERTVLPVLLRVHQGH